MPSLLISNRPPPAVPQNYEQLLGRIARWLRPGGKLFVHIFAHAAPGLPYHFEARGADDWMARHFFSGGTMPSDDLLPRFQRDLALERQWWVNGRHYSRTLEDWLRLHDAARAEVLPLFEKTYGPGQGLKWFVYWRLFYLSCSELFAYDGGERWGVSHYLFTKRTPSGQSLSTEELFKGIDNERSVLTALATRGGGGGDVLAMRGGNGDVQ
jgi:cyclopropane-fatty-acyl-phospholipid synthase